MKQLNIEGRFAIYADRLSKGPVNEEAAMVVAAINDAIRGLGGNPQIVAIGELEASESEEEPGQEDGEGEDEP